MSLTKWGVFCKDENNWVEGWLEGNTEVSSCFNNNLHQINENSKIKIQTSSILNVKIQQEDIPTGGFYAVEGFSFNIAANSVQEKLVSWPFPVTVSVVNLKSSEENKGDIIDTYIGPMTRIGGITTNMEINSKRIQVNSTVLLVLYIGFEFFVNNEFLGRVVSIDKNTSIITLENVCTLFHPIGSPVYCQARPIKNLELGYNTGNELGISNIGGKYLKPNTITKIVYTNNSNLEKKFCFSVEYLF